MKYIGIDFREVLEAETGIGNYTKNLTQEILKLDKKSVYYLIFNKGKTYERYKSLYKNNKNVKVVAIKSKSQSLKSEFILGKELKKLKIDLFWTHIWGSAYILPVPYIITLHDIIGIKNPKYVSVKYRLYNSLHLKWTMSHALKILVPTHAVKSDIIKYFGGRNIKKIKVTGEGVSIPKSYYEGIDVLDKYNINSSFFIYIGNSKPHKNLNILIDSFEEYREKYNKKDSLVLIGVDKNQISGNLENVYILKDINNTEKFEILKKSTALITLSEEEGFCLPLLEATYVKVPIICSDIEVLREVIGDEGALFVDNKDKEDVALNMYRIAQNKEIGEKLVKEAEKRLNYYSWKKTAKKILKYIK